MIPSSAIKKYLAQPRDSHLWIKGTSRADLLDAIKSLRPRPKLYPKLYKHQLACFLLGASFPKFCFWLDMGVGKSLITLELLKYWWRCGCVRRATVFVRSDKAFPTWEKQIKRFGFDLPCVFLEGSSVEKWRKLDEFDKGVVFISYAGAVALVSKTVLGRTKNKWTLDDKLVKRFATDLDAIVLDESTSAAGHRSLTHRLVDKLAASAHIRYALAGRPFGRDPTLLWSQFYLIDGGESLGSTLGLFREAFFTSTPNPWVSPKHQAFVRQYTFDRRREDDLGRMVQHRSIAYAADECIDLPAVQPIVEEVHFPEEAAAYYKRAVRSIIAAKGNMREVKNVFLRMRQLSSGFVGFKDDETGERAEVAFADNPKLDRLLELLEELPADRKAVVFYDFTWSGRRIYEQTKPMGLKPIWLWSGTKDYRSDLHNFETDPKHRLVIVQNRVGAYSLDGLQVANYCFFYESPVSVIDREQAERRLRRHGQVRKVFQVDLTVRGSMDVRILQYHKEGEDLIKSLIRDPGAILGK